MKIILRAGITGLFFLAVVSASAFNPPKLTGRVVDDADVISPQAEAELTQYLQAFEQATSHQLVVVTVSTLDGMEIRQYGVDLARTWGIGQKGKDNGVVLLVAPTERKLAIEVGYGLEGDLPDVVSAHIINNEMLPYFYNGNYEAGIKSGIVAISQVFEGNYEAKPTQSRRELRKKGSWILPVLWIPLMLVFFFGRRRGRRHGSSGLMGGILAGALISRSMGGGGSSGGFGGGFSGGGGSFGGGGASGSW